MTGSEKKKVDNAERELLFQAVREAQDHFWQALYDLESATGLEIDGTRDFTLITLEDLLNEAGE